MFSNTKRKRLPHLVGYVARRKPEVAPNDGLRTLTGCAMGPLALLGIGFALGQVMNGVLAAAMTLLVGTPVVVATLGLLLGRLGRPKTADETRKAAVRSALDVVEGSIDRKRLHRELDPTAAQLMDAAAFYWLAIREVLVGRWWSGAVGQYAALRDQSRRAADEAMDEILLLGISCLGKPGRDKKDDIREAVEDLAELDIAEALEGFRRFASADPKPYTHQSPHIAAVFPTMRDLAEKLKLMAAELADVSQRAAPVVQDLAEIPATSSIDLVLTELKAVRQAESELEEDQRLGS